MSLPFEGWSTFLRCQEFKGFQGTRSFLKIRVSDISKKEKKKNLKEYRERRAVLKNLSVLKVERKISGGSLSSAKILDIMFLKCCCDVSYVHADFTYVPWIYF